MDPVCQYRIEGTKQEIEMVIKGTDKIRGVLQLPSIKKELLKGKEAHISEKDYHTQDIQIALRMGLVQIIEKGAPPVLSADGQEIDKSFVCRSIHGRSISLPGMKNEIKPNQRFLLKESELNSGSIRAAISKGIIEVVSASSDESTYSEGKLKVTDKIGDTPESVDESTAEDAEIEISPAQRALINAMEKNHHRSRKLDTNEEISSFKIIDSETPPAVTKKDIPDPRKQSVVFNPTGENPIETNKNAVYTSGKKEHNIEALKSKSNPVPESSNHEGDFSTNQAESNITSEIIDSTNPSPVDANQNDPKKNNIIVNPHSKPVPKTTKCSTVWVGQKTANSEAQDGPSFVDEEEKKKKRESHPILSQKEEETDSSTELIDLDHETQKKISKHPVLGKKQNQNTEMDFIE